MTTKNDVTGDLIKTKAVTSEYRDNYDRIFKKKLDKPDLSIESLVKTLEMLDANQSEEDGSLEEVIEQEKNKTVTVIGKAEPAN